MAKRDKIEARRRTKQAYPHLDDVFARKVLDRHLARNLVLAGTHDTLPLWVYDYTALAERRRTWDQVTITCRGLVKDNRQRVIARPLQKFFSWRGRSTSAVRSVRWTDEWHAVEKLDGTMVTASNLDGRLLLATRRTFDAWQLDRATELWPEGLIPDPGTTWVLEYVGPDNRIVVPYEHDELALIAVIDNWDGSDLFADYDALCRTGAFRVPVAVEAQTPEDLLAACPADGSFEGFVVVWPRRKGPSGRLKVKSPGWLAAHDALRQPGDLVVLGTDVGDADGCVASGRDATEYMRAA